MVKRSEQNDSSPTFARRGVWVGAGLFSLALLVRWLYLCTNLGNPTFDVPIVDSNYYDMLARGYAKGGGIGRGFFWQPFFYPWFLSMVYRLTDCSIVSAKVLQAVVGALTCLFTYLLGVRAFNHRTGLIAALIVALYGPLIFIEGELLGEGWAAFWSVLLLWLLLKAEARPGWVVYLLLGVCAGLAVITRPTIVPFVVAAGLWIGWRFCRSIDRGAIALGRLAMAAFGLMLILLPVAILNAHVNGRFGVLPDSGSLNLYIGNNPKTDETVVIRPGIEWDRLLTMPDRNGARTAQERRAYYLRQVVEYAWTEPGAFLSGLAIKTAQFFSSRELPRNLSIYLFRTWSPVLTPLVWKVGPFGFPFGLLLPLALWGVCAQWRRTPLPILLFVVLHALSTILVFVSGRYRVPMIPAMSLLAACGVCSLADWVRSRSWRRLAPVTAGMAAVAIVISVPGPFSMETPNYEAELHHFVACSCLERRIKPDEAIAHSRKAIELRPDYSEAYNNLGLLLFRKGDQAAAMSCYQQALKYRPDNSEAYCNIGEMLAKEGKLDEAVAAFQAAARLNPFYEALQLSLNYVEVLDNLARLAVNEGRFDLAVECYQRVVQRMPDDADAHSNLGAALAQLGRVPEAIEQFNTALRLRPHDVDVYRNLGVILARQGQTGEAIAQFEKAARLKPNDPDIRQAIEALRQEQRNPKHFPR